MANQNNVQSTPSEDVWDYDVEIWEKHVFDSRDMSVVVNGNFVPTTPREFDLALLLFRNLSKPLTRDHIMRTVWGQQPDAQSRTVDVHISQIRKRLNLTPQGGFLLSAVYQAGYRLERLSSWEKTPPRGVNRPDDR